MVKDSALSLLWRECNPWPRNLHMPQVQPKRKRGGGQKNTNMLDFSKSVFYFILLYFTILFLVLGLQPQHMEVPWLAVKSELQLPAYTTVTAMPDLSHICNLGRSLWQCQILYPLSKARDRTCILMDTRSGSY